MIQKMKSFKLNSILNVNKKIKIILVFFLVFIRFFVLGNYHIIFNATDPIKAFIFVKRPKV